MNDLKRSATSSIRRVITAGQSRAVLRAAAIAALFACVGLAHTAARVAGVKAGYELGKVEREYRELLREQEHLKLERATLRSATRLESVARTKLGMVPPSAGQIVVVEEEAGRGPRGRVVAAVERERDTANP
jgi:cell division protein FtsL